MASRIAKSELTPGNAAGKIQIPDSGMSLPEKGNDI